MRTFCIALLMAACSVAAAAQRGALTVHQNLEQLTAEAAIIVRARVVSATVEPHPQLSGLTTIVVRLQVQETMKGAPRRTYTFRQYVWDIRDKMDGALYRKGEDLVLFLNAANEHGLSAPIGLEQGRFRVLRDAAGREVALNGRGNHRLLEGMSEGALDAAPAGRRKAMREHRQGPLAIEDLKALVRGAREAQR
jgi:hypothetical protein